jgi:hypothetical protein
MSPTISRKQSRLMTPWLRYNRDWRKSHRSRVPDSKPAQYFAESQGDTDFCVVTAVNSANEQNPDSIRPLATIP